MSVGKDPQFEWRLDQKLALRDFFKRCGELYAAARLYGHDEGQIALVETWFLKDSIDVDVVLRECAGDTRDDSRTVPDYEAQEVWRNTIASELKISGRPKRYARRIPRERQ